MDNCSYAIALPPTGCTHDKLRFNALRRCGKFLSSKAFRSPWIGRKILPRERKLRQIVHAQYATLDD